MGARPNLRRALRTNARKGVLPPAPHACDDFEAYRVQLVKEPKVPNWQQGPTAVWHQPCR